MNHTFTVHGYVKYTQNGRFDPILSNLNFLVMEMKMALATTTIAAIQMTVSGHGVIQQAVTKNGIIAIVTRSFPKTKNLISLTWHVIEIGMFIPSL